MHLFFIKLENRREESCLGEGQLVQAGGRRMWKKGVGGQIWCKYCIYMYVNGRMKTIETIPEMGGKE
jgi:hypothetical protein